jgi:hypothetical protein
MPLVEGLLKETRGVTFEEIEKEAYDYERLKRVALQGLFDGNILKGYKGNTFEEKFNNYLYTSGIERCKWITKTGYRIYYQTFCNHISKLNSDRDAISLINKFVKEGGKSTTQALTKILVKSKFFEDSPRIDETIIDEHIEIFRESGAIAEGYLKLIYGIKHNCHTNHICFIIWKNLKQDSNLGVFTKPFPNTIYWNALKHNKFRKSVGSCEIEFRSNNGRRILNYPDFRSLIRELFACTLVLTKINLMLRFASKG